VYELAGILLSEAYHVERIPQDRGMLILGAFLWEMDQLGYGLETYLTLVSGPGWVDTWRPPATTTAPEWMSLLTLWTPPISEWEADQLVAGLHYSVLLSEYIAETHGVEKVPLLLDELETASTMDEWATAVTGQSLDQLEADWRVWVIDGRTER
jgi:hypothetical protein